MTAIPLENEIFYPESDGEPMAETRRLAEERADAAEERAVAAEKRAVAEAEARRQLEERIRALEEENARLRQRPQTSVSG